MRTLLDDVRGGCTIFVVGAVGGSVFCFVDGALSSSSRGCRLNGGIQGVVTNAPRVRRCAAWSGVVMAIVLRVKYSGWGPYESLSTACGGANALFSVHKGPSAAVRKGLKGALYGGATVIAIKMLGRFLDSVESSS
jgi:hypothetical protein